MDAAAIAEGVAQGQRLAVARLITLAESEAPEAAEILQRLHPRMGRAHVVGITGSPGTGKSTLVDRLIEHHRRAGRRVGVVAVDPSSPFTGGAILGDRIRMQLRSTDPGVFIRSMGSRGALGGLAVHTSEAVQVLDAAGYDVVLVETVGVGQGEVEVVRLADTVVVVLVPNLGDDVQAVKAGVMEIADVFCVNKADLIGADKVAADVEASLQLAHGEEGAWDPPVVRASAEKGQGVAELAEAIERHRAWSERHGTWHTRRARRLVEQVRGLLAKRVLDRAFERNGAPRAAYADLFAAAQRGEASPQQVVQRILDDLRE